MNPLQCPNAKYHKFFMGVCDHCGMTRRTLTKLTKERRTLKLREARAARPRQLA